MADFIKTIEDDFEFSSEEITDRDPLARKTSKKRGRRDSFESGDLINPNFTFYIEGAGSYIDFDNGWDFKAAKAGLKDKSSVS